MDALPPYTHYDYCYFCICAISSSSSSSIIKGDSDSFYEISASYVHTLALFVTLLFLLLLSFNDSSHLVIEMEYEKWKKAVFSMGD